MDQCDSSTPNKATDIAHTGIFASVALFPIFKAGPGDKATCRFKEVEEILDALENDLVAPPQHDGTLLCR